VLCGIRSPRPGRRLRPSAIAGSNGTSGRAEGVPIVSPMSTGSVHSVRFRDCASAFRWHRQVLRAVRDTRRRPGVAPIDGRASSTRLSRAADLHPDIVHVNEHTRFGDVQHRLPARRGGRRTLERFDRSVGVRSEESSSEVRRRQHRRREGNRVHGPRARPLGGSQPGTFSNTSCKSFTVSPEVVSSPKAQTVAPTENATRLEQWSSASTR
jgi:hypothetical protein